MRVRLLCAASFQGDPSQQGPLSTSSSAKLGALVYPVAVPKDGLWLGNDEKGKEGREERELL